MKRIIFLILLLYWVLPIQSGELTFIPAYISGNPPETLANKDNLSNGIAQLGTFYARENLNTKVTNFDEVKKFIYSSNFSPNKKPDRNILSSICSEFDSDYIIKSEVDFSNRANILTEVYNCKGNLINSHDSSVDLDLFDGFESNIVSALNFLPKKSGSKKATIVNEDIKEVIFVLDLSGSLSREIQSSARFIQSLVDDPNYSVGLLLVSSKKNQFIRPEIRSKKVSNALSQLKFLGEVNPKQLYNGLATIKNNYTKKNKLGKIIIITDTVLTTENNSEFYSAVQNLKQVHYDVHLITGSFFNNKSLALHEKVARAGGNELHKITNYQKIGTTNGFRIVYLHDHSIYFSEGEKPRKLYRLEELVQVDHRFIYSTSKFPHPENMSDIYAKASKEKIIERGKIQSNIDDILQRLITSNKSIKATTKKILLKTLSKTIWINVASTKGVKLNKEIFIRTTFIKDKYSSTGFSNLPNETLIYKEDVPRLLVFTPSELAKYFRENSVSYRYGFIKGTVMDMR